MCCSRNKINTQLSGLSKTYLGSGKHISENGLQSLVCQTMRRQKFNIKTKKRKIQDESKNVKKYPKTPNAFREIHRFLKRTISSKHQCLFCSTFRQIQSRNNIVQILPKLLQPHVVFFLVIFFFSKHSSLRLIQFSSAKPFIFKGCIVGFTVAGYCKEKEREGVILQAQENYRNKSSPRLFLLLHLLLEKQYK